MLRSFRFWKYLLYKCLTHKVECTINAIKNRLARIKSKMNQANGNASSPSTTPIKPKRGKPSKKRPAEDDEDQENATKQRIGGGSDCWIRISTTMGKSMTSIVVVSVDEDEMMGYRRIDVTVEDERNFWNWSIEITSMVVEYIQEFSRRLPL